MIGLGSDKVAQALMGNKVEGYCTMYAARTLQRKPSCGLTIVSVQRWGLRWFTFTSEYCALVFNVLMYYGTNVGYMRYLVAN